MPDKTIKCVQCCAEFVFTAGEQKYYAEREFAHETLQDGAAGAEGQS